LNVGHKCNCRGACGSCRTTDHLEEELAELDALLEAVDECLAAHDEGRRAVKMLVNFAPIGTLAGFPKARSEADSDPLRHDREDLRRRRAEVLRKLCEVCPDCTACREHDLGNTCLACVSREHGG
jgi:hypothetical protein